MNGKELKSIIERSGIRANAFAEKLGIAPQSLNFARHSWATIAAELDIPDDVISQALGHAARNSTTAIYIERNIRKVDEANRKVIDWVLYGKR